MEKWMAQTLNSYDIQHHYWLLHRTQLQHYIINYHVKCTVYAIIIVSASRNVECLSRYRMNSFLSTIFTHVKENARCIHN